MLFLKTEKEVLYNKLKCLHIRQKVDYPLELDVYDLCSDDLKKKLEAPRKVFKLELSFMQFFLFIHLDSCYVSVGHFQFQLKIFRL